MPQGMRTQLLRKLLGVRGRENAEKLEETQQVEEMRVVKLKEKDEEEGMDEL